ncbi:hypothetical protein AAFC00_004074 [Neodothiora populina]|uniref:Serine/arginine repetitive matrix protein 1 n=1 Tax=Neodothiora populina TaxID=2781224 RepID=A0ABR3PIP2_9PEZI
MKKFGLGLSHMIPSRSDEKQHMATDNLITQFPPDYTPPPSPYPGRRSPLNPRIEVELRAACVAVLTNQRPSHIPNNNYDEAPRPSAKAQLDYSAIKQSLDKSTEHRTQPTKSRSALTNGYDEPQPGVDARQYAYKPELPVADLFARSNVNGHTNGHSASNSNGGNHTGFPVRASSLRRADQLLLADPTHRRTKSGSAPQTNQARVPNSFSTQHDRPRGAQRQGSHETSGSTPRTDVTEYLWNTSTAPTSAGVTPARASNRTSTNVPSEMDSHVKSDSNPIDWIRHEIHKHNRGRSRRPSEGEPRTNTRATSRARSIKSVASGRSVRSLANSVKDGIMDYVRPGSRSRDPSRTRSRSRANNGQRSDVERYDSRGQAVRPPPRRDWRNWGRSNKDDGSITSGEVSRSNSTRGRSDGRRGHAKPDLNRELPPLPSLDQWKESAIEEASHPPPVKSPVSISRSATIKSSAVSEKDEIVAARLGSPVKAKPEVYMPTRPQNNGHTISRKPVSQSHTGMARTTDTDREARDGGQRVERTVDDMIGIGPPAAHMNSHTHNRSFDVHPPTGSNLRAPMSSQHSRSGSSLSRSLSVKLTQSRTSSDTSKPSSHMATPTRGFSRHRKYDQSSMPPALATEAKQQGPTHGQTQSQTQGQIQASAKGLHEGQDSRYHNFTEIHASPLPPHAAKEADKKGWWHLKGKPRKGGTWMDQLEKLGIRDGVLLNDEVNRSPVVRY